MKPNKKQTCRSDLIQRILMLEIEPGSVLDETALSSEYELSRTPLREVFQRLAGEGYLALEENRGAKVSSMDFTSMRNFFQTAPMIYAAVARLATENANNRQIDRLKNAQLNFRLAGTHGNANEMVMNNHAFHECIGEMAANPYLTPSLNRLLIDHTRMSQFFYRPANEDERALVIKASDQHDQMIAAIENRQPAVIVDLTLEHWALSRDSIERFVRPDPLPVDGDFEYQEEDRHAV
ncbi:MAG: GntR family transcriptional regulator [Pseudomonadota bacterium]